MRIGLIVGLLVAALVVVAVVSHLLASRPHAPRAGEPETVPAAYALTYAQAVRAADTRTACAVLLRDAARDAACGAAKPHPRACGSFTIEGTKIVHFSGSSATVQVGSCRIDLVATAQEWGITKVRS